MTRTRIGVALFAFGLLSLVGDPRADAQGVPRPILPVVMVPSSYLVADYDTTTVHAKWGLAIGQADVYMDLSGTTLATSSDGRFPAPSSRFLIHFVTQQGAGLSQCLVMANQARLTGAKHTLRVNVSFKKPVQVKADGVDGTYEAQRVECELDP